MVSSVLIANKLLTYLNVQKRIVNGFLHSRRLFHVNFQSFFNSRQFLQKIKLS